MNALRFTLFVLLALLAFTVLAHEANAAHTSFTGSCSTVTVASAATGHLQYAVAWADDGPADGSCLGSCGVTGSVTDANYCGANLPSKSPVNLYCTLTSTGTLPPTVATSIVISGYKDSDSNGGGGTPIWTTTLASCATYPAKTTFAKSLTTDGSVGAAAQAGTVRLYIQAINTGVGTSYTCNSDDAGTQTAPTLGSCNPAALPSYTGVMRSNPGISGANLTAGSPCATGCNVYTGGDTLSLKLTDNATQYNAGTRLQMLVQTGGGVFTNVGSALSLVAGTQTQTSIVQGNAATWLQGAIILKYTESGASSISGFSGLSYWTFTAASVSGGSTVVSANVITFDPTDILSRTLTENAHCLPQVLGTSATIVNRGETVTSQCRWLDGRGIVVDNLDFGRTWVQRATQYRITTDFGLSDQAFSGGTGQQSAINVATTTATVTTGSAYRFFAEQFDLTTRTDASLENWGNSTNQLDVSSTYTFDSLLNSKSAGGANVSSFTISADTEHAKALGLRDATGNPLNAVDIVCFRTRPDHVNEGTVDFGNTNSGGNTGDNPLGVIAPAGTWMLTCTVTSNGNTGQYVISFFFTSAFTADKASTVNWNVTDLNNGSSRVNITMHFTFYDISLDRPNCAFIDDLARLTVVSFNVTTQDYDINETVRSIMNPTITLAGFYNCDWAYNFTMPNANLTLGAFADVTFNFTGSPFIGSQGYILKTQSGSTNIMGAITTAADPYIPLVFWLGLIILFLYFEAYIAAGGAIIAIADAMLDGLTPSHTVFGFYGRMLMFLVLLVAQAILTLVRNRIAAIANGGNEDEE